jgi:hypothetical protein
MGAMMASWERRGRLASLLIGPKMLAHPNRTRQAVIGRHLAGLNTLQKPRHERRGLKVGGSN